MKTRAIAAAALAGLLLTACGGEEAKTPSGLQAALDEDGIGLDPATSAQRYYDAVNNLCSLEGDYSTSTLRGFAQPENAEALERMVVALEYMCEGQGRALENIVGEMR